MLFLCENGFEDIIIPEYKTAKDNKIAYDILSDDIETEEMIDTILKYPAMLKYPIVFDEKKILIGYNSEDIRMFLPREYKRLLMSSLK
jgi:regulatory protein spx